MGWIGRLQGPSLRVQVFALVVASLAVSIGLAIAILVLMPPPRPTPVTLRDVALALNGGALRTSFGRVLVRSRAPAASLSQTSALPPPMLASLSTQRAALAGMLGVPAARVILDPQPFEHGLGHLLDVGRGPPHMHPHGDHGPDHGPGFGRQPGDDLLFGEFTAAVATPQGDLVVVRPAPEPFPTSWQIAVSAWLAGSALVLTPLAFWLSRRISKPFDDFAEAAEQLGRDPRAQPLRLSGPLEVRRAARAFNEMQVRVRRYVEDRTGMVGAISHDLRTPLARMRFKLEATPVNKPAISSDIDQMEAMIGQVLTFLREAREPGERARINLLSLVETAVDEAVEGGSRVQLVREDDAMVEGDVNALHRVLGNLISNAVKYGERADVSVIAAPREIRVEIEDDGPGLAPAERERVFHPFYRTDEARTLDVGGVGLGLAVSRSVARAHGGDVSLDVRGRGLVAILTLPTVEQLAPARR